jgi:serine/threonine-protein kinase
MLAGEAGRTGEVIDGKYRLDRLLGRGGMGEVYLAEQLNMERNVAIKLMGGALSGDDEHFRRFLREAAAMSRVTDPHVVTVFDYGDDPEPYLVMEYLDGQSLASLIRGEAPLPPERAVRITAQVCDALTASHEREVIHRDVKPDNIYLVKTAAPGDFVKVLDFGVAKVTFDEARTLTRHGDFCGTPHYMSPEQARGEPVPQSDVYSLAVVLYEMLTGRRPFQGKLPDLLLAHANQSPPSIPKEFPGLNVPVALQRCIEHALQKNPAKRPESSASFKSGLLDSLSTASGRPPPSMLGRLPWRGLIGGLVVVLGFWLSSLVWPDMEPLAPLPVSLTQVQPTVTQPDLPVGSEPILVPSSPLLQALNLNDLESFEERYLLLPFVEQMGSLDLAALWQEDFEAVMERATLDRQPQVDSLRMQSHRVELGVIPRSNEKQFVCVRLSFYEDRLFKFAVEFSGAGDLISQVMQNWLGEPVRQEEKGTTAGWQWRLGGHLVELSAKLRHLRLAFSHEAVAEATDVHYARAQQATEEARELARTVEIGSREDVENARDYILKSRKLHVEISEAPKDLWLPAMDLTRCRAHFVLGEYGKARQACGAALEGTQENSIRAQARYFLAVLIRVEGNPEGALRQLQKARRLLDEVQEAGGLCKPRQGHHLNRLMWFQRPLLVERLNRHIDAREHAWLEARNAEDAAGSEDARQILRELTCYRREGNPREEQLHAEFGFADQDELLRWVRGKGVDPAGTDAQLECPSQ